VAVGTISTDVIAGEKINIQIQGGEFFVILSVPYVHTPLLIYTLRKKTWMLVLGTAAAATPKDYAPLRRLCLALIP
jgi:hypothetical protein